MLKIYAFELIQSICAEDKSSLLSELDISEIKTLPKQKSKNYELSLIGKILTKRIISNETLTSPKNVLIGKTKLGKPIVLKPNNLNLDISISHSDSYLVIGICDNGKIGIDIEFLKDIDFQIFRGCLSVDEEKYINSGKEITKRLENFYEIWTRKEAYLKALGIGLQKPMPITQFYSCYIKPTVAIEHDNQQYFFSTLKENKYVLSVCTTSLSSYNQKYTKLTLDKHWNFVINSKTIHRNIQSQ